jgi:serine/threonine-protein kinase
LAWYDTVPASRSYPTARKAADRAIELDPDLAEAYATLGVIAYEFEWDWARAEANFRRALELRPNYAAARHWYAALLSNLGRHGEAIAEGEGALALDPLSTVISADVAGVLWSADSTDRAIALLDHAIARDVAPPPIIEMERATILLYESRWDSAAESLERWARVAGFADAAAVRRIAAAASGDLERAGALDTLAQMEAARAASREDLIPLYAILGDIDAALEGAERAAATRNPWVIWMGTLPWYDLLREEPRFQAVLANVGLPNDG